jgi:hypothetical protein
MKNIAGFGESCVLAGRNGLEYFTFPKLSYYQVLLPFFTFMGVGTRYVWNFVYLIKIVQYWYNGTQCMTDPYDCLVILV